MQIYFIDCLGTESSVSLSYQIAGWLYYLSQILNTLSQWAIACIFMMTALRLYQLLEIDKARRDIIAKNWRTASDLRQSSLVRLEGSVKKAKCCYQAALVYSIVMALLIVALYAAVMLVKANKVEQKVLTASGALKIDSMQLFAYLIFFITLTAALVVFHLMNRRHKMKIKRF